MLIYGLFMSSKWLCVKVPSGAVYDKMMAMMREHGLDDFSESEELDASDDGTVSTNGVHSIKPELENFYDMNKKPSWLRVRAPQGKVYNESVGIVRENGLNTVCEEAACPNIGECWNRKHVTVMIMGSTCTRGCAFCNINTGIPSKLEESEPERVALTAEKLGLRHIVITSVDRDDLSDGGADHFVKCINAVRERCSDTTIEILTPDFRRKKNAILHVASACPDVYNHNIETVPSLYAKIRPGARYFGSLHLLKLVKEFNSSIFTKSGFMVGLGETKDEVLQVMDDLRSADVDFLTIGQYLRPTLKHAEVKRFVTPEEFKFYKDIAIYKGFSMVSSSPLTRSSYHADEDFLKLYNMRKLQLENQ